MKFSRNTLQKFIIDTLPSKDALIEKISAKAFEVESVEEVTLAGGASDEIYEIKVLPNRSHDANGHAFMAREIANVLDIKFNEEYWASQIMMSYAPTIENNLNIKIADKKACTRFVGLRVENIKVSDSPKEIKEFLHSIGQKNINNIVDITNYVLFVLNKPMHAYDADKVVGDITVRFAQTGEMITTLDNREVTLDEKILIIADDAGPLSIAGIKGGNRAAVDANTKNIILESANFNASLIRRTSQRLNIKTDASKRYENELSDSLCFAGLNMTLIKILEQLPDAKYGQLMIDAATMRDWQYKVGVSQAEVNSLTGLNLSVDEIKKYLAKISMNVKYFMPEMAIHQQIDGVLDKPYKLDTSMRLDAPDYFSCSSLISYLYLDAGVWMPSLVIDKYFYFKDIKKEDLKYGDLIFALTNGRAYQSDDIIRRDSVEFEKGKHHLESGVDHVGMYLGDNKVLHASGYWNAGKVIIEDLSESKSFSDKTIIGYKRVLDDIGEGRFVCIIPQERLDLRTKEDLIEEVVRYHGLDNIPSVIPDLKKDTLHHSEQFTKEIAIKNILFNHDFSEVINYSFTNKNGGTMEVMKAVAEDKSFLRNDIRYGLKNAAMSGFIDRNRHGTEMVKIFEIGSVFENKIEKRNICIAVSGTKKDVCKKEFESIFVELNIPEADRILREPIEIINAQKGFIYLFECDIEKLNIQSENIFLNTELKRDLRYRDPSSYPWTSHDVSFFASDTNATKLQQEFEGLNLQDCVNIYKFDEFTKKLEDGTEKTSYAFRFIFQSNDKTLTSEESLAYFAKVTEFLKSKNYEVR